MPMSTRDHMLVGFSAVSSILSATVTGYQSYARARASACLMGLGDALRERLAGCSHRIPSAGGAVGEHATPLVGVLRGPGQEKSLAGAGHRHQQDPLILCQLLVGVAVAAGDEALLQSHHDDPVELLPLAGVRVQDVHAGADRGGALAVADAVRELPRGHPLSLVLEQLLAPVRDFADLIASSPGRGFGIPDTGNRISHNGRSTRITTARP